MPSKDRSVRPGPQAETRPENEDGDLSEEAQAQFDEMHQNESPGRAPAKADGPRTDRAGRTAIDKSGELGGDGLHDKLNDGGDHGPGAVDLDRQRPSEKMDREQEHTDATQTPGSDKGREAKERQRREER